MHTLWLADYWFRLILLVIDCVFVIYNKKKVAQKDIVPMPHNVAQSTQIRRFTHVYSLHYIILIYTRKFGQEEEKEKKKPVQRRRHRSRWWTKMSKPYIMHVTFGSHITIDIEICNFNVTKCGRVENQCNSAHNMITYYENGWSNKTTITTMIIVWLFFFLFTREQTMSLQAWTKTETLHKIINI